jgi:hypothetical protein
MEIREMRAERELRKANRKTPKELAPLLTGASFSKFTVVLSFDCS